MSRAAASTPLRTTDQNVLDAVAWVTTAMRMLRLAARRALVGLRRGLDALAGEQVGLADLGDLAAAARR